jgi:hypothetical protein
MKLEFEYVGCDLCGSDDAKLLFLKRGRLTGFNFRIVKCRKCGLIYVNPRLSKDSLKSLYNESYYKGEGFDNYVEYVRDYERGYSLKFPYREILDTIESIVGGLRGKYLLDVGCGLGLLLKFARERMPSSRSRNIKVCV